MNNQILCACGCGELINKFDKRGREVRFKYRHQLRGIPRTQEVKDKISKSLSGKPFPKRGIPLTEEQKRKNSESHKGKHFSPETEFKKGRLQPRGENHWNWKGGLTSLHEQIRNSSKMLEWKNQIRGRDNWTCRHCNSRGVWLEAHHIKSLKEMVEENHITTLEEALSCKELWDIDNGITYCNECHKLLKQKGGKL